MFTMLYIYLYGILVVLFTLGRSRDVMPYAVPLASRATEYLMVKSCMSADGGDNFLLPPANHDLPIICSRNKTLPCLAQNIFDDYNIIMNSFHFNHE